MTTKQRPKINIVIKYPSKVFNKHIYDKLYNYDNFTEVHYGGASSGKSHGVFQKIILKALNPKFKHPRKILVLRKVGATVRDSVFADIMSNLSYFGVLDKCKINMSAFRITLPN
ncbi:PBSX family phage terminase large subunit, partial [Streptococcus agalactiae]|uniref:phage terminase large subunit n=2 Tax=Streptococcus TaxID=1301 RepID=UPI001C8F7FB2